MSTGKASACFSLSGELRNAAVPQAQGLTKAQVLWTCPLLPLRDALLRVCFRQDYSPPPEIFEESSQLGDRSGQQSHAADVPPDCVVHAS